jgi:hypothetical protein
MSIRAEKTKLFLDVKKYYLENDIPVDDWLFYVFVNFPYKLDRFVWALWER